MCVCCKQKTAYEMRISDWSSDVFSSDLDYDPDRKWALDYFAIAGGVLTSPRYNGADDNVVLPGGYLRGRISGFSFSTRGTNFQVDLIRQRRGQRIDWKLGPVVNLRSDRTGRIGDPQVEALGEKKVALELGLTGGQNGRESCRERGGTNVYISE